MYGARIKTWSGKTTGTATTIVYEDIIVDNVKNPIILDQDYGRNNAEVFIYLIFLSIVFLESLI